MEISSIVEEMLRYVVNYEMLTKLYPSDISVCYYLPYIYL